MEAFSPGWWLSLLAIVLIDLVLTGERAVLIAEAARQLPRRLYGGALAAGTVLALLLRVLMTVGLLWLLQTPGLLLLGGIVLLGIAWRTQARRHRGLVLQDTPAQGFWGTLRSVVVAEALMGLDNVLAVAGAARNSVDLVVIGLLLTVPMIVFGSRHLPRLLAQIPLLRTLGAAVMAMTAGRMMANEPIWLRDFFATSTLWYWGFVLGLTLLVLLTGWRRKPAPTPAPDRS